jgi:hypothetical protein
MHQATRGLKLTKRTVRRGVAIGGLIITSSLLLFAQLPPTAARVVEGLLYACGLLGLSTQPALSQMLRALPVPYQGFVYCLTALIVVGQLWRQPQKTFPFVSWAMYSYRAVEPPKYYEFIGIGEGGREILIPANAVFLTQHRTLVWRMMAAWSKSQSAEDEERREFYAERYRASLSAMVRRFNEQEPDAHVKRVRVIEHTMPRPAPGLKLEVSSKVQAEFVIE